ncbi:MAG: B12-binding domain-containing radical SAM protein [Myxococcota bacterium]
MQHTLLLRPPARTPSGGGLRVPPLGLAYLAATLRAQGRRVTLLDALGENLRWEELPARVAALQPDVLGLSAMTPVRDVAHRAAKLLREQVDAVVLGGPHPTAVGSVALSECPALDFIIQGEGEASFPLLLDALHAHPGPASSLTHPVPGVISRHADGGPAPELDPDALPFPARDLLPNAGYRYPLATRGPITTLITSRGCPWRCTFCDQAVTGRRWRERSPDNVLEELALIVRQGFRYVCIYDDNFTLDTRRVEDICLGMLRRNIRLDWKCEARVDGVHPELLQLMARAGCKTIAYGLESANQVGLDALKKDSTVEEATRAFRWTRRAGIEIMAYVLLGIPGENPSLARRTFDFCEREGVSYVQFSTLSAVPGTSLYDEAVQKGWLTGADIRSPFDDDLERATIVAPGWTEESLQQTVQEAWRRFYLHPRFVWRHALRSVRGGQLGAQLREGARVLGAWAGQQL